MLGAGPGTEGQMREPFTEHRECRGTCSPLCPWAGQTARGDRRLLPGHSSWSPVLPGSGGRGFQHPRALGCVCSFWACVLKLLFSPTGSPETVIRVVLKSPCSAETAPARSPNLNLSPKPPTCISNCLLVIPKPLA